MSSFPDRGAVTPADTGDSPDQSTAAHLVDVHPSLVLFAEGIAGVPVRIEALDAAGPGWPWSAAVDDPLVIRLPAVMDAFETSAANRRAYRTQVLQQLNLRLLATAPNDRHEPHTLVAAAPNPALVGELFSLFENCRVASATKRLYPGAAAGLDEGMKSALERLDDSRPTPERAVRMATLGAVAETSMSGGELVDEWVAKLRRPQASTDHSAEAALEVAELLMRVARRSRRANAAATEALIAEAMDDDVVTDDVADEDGEISQALGAALGSTLPPVEAMMVDDLDGAVADGELPVAERVEKPVRGRRPGKRSWAVADIETDGRSFLYDEWDDVAGRYRPAWCRVVEESLVGDDHDFIGRVRRTHRELGARIRRSFAQLRPQERVRRHRRLDGDDLDIDAVVEAMVDLRGGRTPDDTLHLRREPLLRDVATAFLVDLSASTSSAVEEPEPTPLDEYGNFEFVEYPSRGVGGGSERPLIIETRKVIDVAKESVALMCDALGQLGDRHAVFGFSGTGRKNVQFVVAKRFDERTSPSTWSALAAMKPITYTRMGPAIRHATAHLVAQESHVKILLVISDGYPQDVDYGDDRGDRSYGIADTARALEEARALGVDPFCVTIDPAGHDYLRVMCPDERYLVIDDVAALPDELAKLYLSLTKSTI